MRLFFIGLMTLAFQSSFALDDTFLTEITQIKPEQQVTVYINAHLVRPSYDHNESFNGKLLNGIVGLVVVVGDKIEAVLESPPVTAKAIKEKVPTAVVIDLTGKFLMPGLHDMHVHNYGMNADLPNSPIFTEDGSPVEHLDFPGQEAMNYRMAFGGITSHLDLMSFNDLTLKMKQNQSQLKGVQSVDSQSRIFMSGGLFHVEGSHHGDLSWLIGKREHTTIAISRGEIVEEKNAEKRYQALKLLLSDHINFFQPDVLKVSYDHNPHRPGQKEIIGMSKDLLREFVVVANEIQPGIPVVCHIGTWNDVEECVDAGAKAVTHLPFEQSNDPAYRMPEGIIKKLIAKNVFVIPTMTTYMDNSLIKESIFDTTVTKVAVDKCEPEQKQCFCAAVGTCFLTEESGVLNGRKHFFNEPLLNEVAPQRLLEHYFDFQFYAGNPWIQWGVEHNLMGYRQRVFNRLATSGVKILAGTDTMWEGTFFGFSLHREFELMASSNNSVKAPERLLSTMEILRTATSANHEFLNHFRGQIAQGFYADMIVLNENPIEDIKNTKSIQSVIINGKPVDREALKPLMKVD